MTCGNINWRLYQTIKTVIVDILTQQRVQGVCMYTTGTWQPIHMDKDRSLNTAGGRMSLGRSLCVQDTLSVAVVECVCVYVCVYACVHV